MSPNQIDDVIMVAHEFSRLLPNDLGLETLNKRILNFGELFCMIFSCGGITKLIAVHVEL